MMNSDSENKLSEEVIDIDIERQNEIGENLESKITLPLRGILKKPDDQFNNIQAEKIIAKICISLLVIIIMLPFIICDLYFGFTDNSCSREQPNELAISIRLYLIVSGFVNISATIIILTGLNFIDTEKLTNSGICALCCGTIGLSCIIIFNTIWNILGAVVFWGYIYGNGNCNKNFSTYVFISLIIKLVSALFGYQLNKKNDKN